MAIGRHNDCLLTITTSPSRPSVMPADSSARITPVIHIGLPKTATTTLQKRLFARHSEVLYLGRYVDDNASDPCHHYWSCISEQVSQAMQDLNVHFVHDPNIAQCRDQLHSAMAEATERRLVPVWSWESYATDLLSRRRLRARNLKALFGHAKIMICLRNPISLIEAAYFFQLKRDNISPDYCRWHKPYYLTIDAWLDENYQHEVGPHLDYAETIKTYIKFFGRDNVHVFLFEDLVADQVSFTRQLCAVMGIDAEESLDLLRGASDNQRMSAAQIDRLKHLAQSHWKSAVFQFTPARLRTRLYRLEAGGDDPSTTAKPRATLSAAWRERIFDDVRAGNQWLKNIYSLNLDGYGYSGFNERNA
jgi:hypothetical protein